MKANDLIKKPFPITEIYKNIEDINNNNGYKLFYPHHVFIDDETKLQLIKDGFKVYEGEWFKGDKGLIIEW